MTSKGRFQFKDIIIPLQIYNTMNKNTDTKNQE